MHAFGLISYPYNRWRVLKVLIHKASRGVLQYCWNNQGTAIVKANFRNFPELNNDEWFEVTTKDHFYLTAITYYPEIILIVNEGKLVDVVRVEKRKVKTSFQSRRKRMLSIEGTKRNTTTSVLPVFWIFFQMHL